MHITSLLKSWKCRIDVSVPREIIFNLYGSYTHAIIPIIKFWSIKNKLMFPVGQVHYYGGGISVTHTYETPFNGANNYYTRWYKNNVPHRENGPAIEGSDGHKAWLFNGKFHREDGPAVELSNGDKRWYLNNKLDRKDGPAMEYSNGDKVWYRNNQMHREDGPAVDRIDGSKEWRINGLLHREDGPAIENDNRKAWYFNGIECDEKELEVYLFERKNAELIKRKKKQTIKKAISAHKKELSIIRKNYKLARKYGFNKVKKRMLQKSIGEVRKKIKEVQVQLCRIDKGLQ